MALVRTPLNEVSVDRKRVTSDGGKRERPATRARDWRSAPPCATKGRSGRPLEPTDQGEPWNRQVNGWNETRMEEDKEKAR